MGCSSESVAYSRIVASYRRRMGVVAVREMARHRIRQSKLARSFHLETSRATVGNDVQLLFGAS